MGSYFISRRSAPSEPFRLVYREVKTRTRKGYPLTFEITPLEGEYATWEEAQAALEALLGEFTPGSLVCPPWPW